MGKGGRAYFGQSWIISVVLAIIPFTNVLCGIITRAMRGNILGVVLNIVLCFVFYFIDLITIIVKKDLTVLA